jgi:hypothetical protein
LRKELADTTARSGRSSPTSIDTLNGGPSDEDVSNVGGSPLMLSKGLPSATPDDVPAQVAQAVLADKKDQ